MSNFHACFKKYINFPLFCCIFGFAKIKEYAIRPPSILYIFSKFLSQKEIQLWMKMHLALRVSTRMPNKRTSAQTDQRLLYTALSSNVMRTCKGGEWKRGTVYVLNINLLPFLFNSKFTCLWRQ